MPTYQYECERCGYSFEELQSMAAPKLTQCPECAQENLVRLIGTGTGIIFKGSGFYETDYKRSDSSKSESSSSEGGEKPAAEPQTVTSANSDS